MHVACYDVALTEGLTARARRWSGQSVKGQLLSIACMRTARLVKIPVTTQRKSPQAHALRVTAHDTIGQHMHVRARVQSRTSARAGRAEAQRRGVGVVG